MKVAHTKYRGWIWRERERDNEEKEWKDKLC